MKRLLKFLVTRTVANESSWPFFERTVMRCADHARGERARIESARDLSKLKMLEELCRICPERKVLHGPFNGMVYPEHASFGSTLAPKLIGCYERELHSLLNELLMQRYTAIVDIGCAEGYYAVGFALRFPGAKIHAFDTEGVARELCRNMAACNGVSDRVSIGGFCDADVLASLPLGDRALIVSDCEGFERELFSSSVIEVLSRHDFLIETHDFIDLRISTMLKGRLAKSHRLRSIYSIDDIQKVHENSYPELDGMDPDEIKRLVGEYRPATMEWLFATPHRAS